MSKLKKKLKTQGKNSKLKMKTQKVGTFRIPGCRKSVQKKPGLNIIDVMVMQAFFVHFFAGSLRPAACGALSFQGEKLSFGSKNISFFHTGRFFWNF